MSGMGPVLACSGAYRALAAVYSLVLLVQQVLGGVCHVEQHFKILGELELCIFGSFLELLHVV